MKLGLVAAVAAGAFGIAISAEAKTYTVTVTDTQLTEITNNDVILGYDASLGSVLISGSSVTPTDASRINDNGDSIISSGYPYAAAVVIGGVKTVLMPPARPGEYLQYEGASAINDSDTVLLEASYGISASDSGNLIFYLYHNGTYTTVSNLPSPDYSGQTEYIPQTLNNLNRITGFYITQPATTGEFIDDNGSFSSFNVPGAIYTNLKGLNDNGVTIGSYVAADGVTSGFIDAGGTITDLNDPLAIPGTTTPESINDAGVVVGSYATSEYLNPPGYQGGTFYSTHGFIYDDGVFTTLDLGTSVITLQPLPEPATWVLMLIGVGGLGGVLRRKRGLSVAGSADRPK